MKLNLITRSNLCLGIALASTLGTRPCDAMLISSETKSEQQTTLIIIEKKESLPPPLPEDCGFTVKCFVIRPEEDSFEDTYFLNEKIKDSFGRPPKQIGSRKNGFKKPFSRRR